MDIRSIYKGTFLVLCVISIFSYDRNMHSVPSNEVFEVLLLLTFSLVSRAVTNNKTILAYFIFAFLCLKTFVNIAIFDINIIDFVIANKFLIYLIIILTLSNVSFNGWEDFATIYSFILFFFLAKYSISVFGGFNLRPSLFTENNFELMFLLISSIAYHENIKPLNYYQLSSIALTFTLSGSRSGLLCLLVSFFIYSLKNITAKTLINAMMLLIGSVVTYFVFESRIGDGGLSSIDRFKFFQGFLMTTRDWGLLDYTFGNFIMEKVDQSVCKSLWYYKSLMSVEDGYTCYANVFHSFILRIIYDFGLFGFVFSFYSLYISLKDKISNLAIISIISTVMINGLSVSSLNSVYCLLGIVIILFTSKSSKNETSDIK